MNDDILVNDTEIVDWIEEHLCYAIVTIVGNVAESLPNTGHGWKNDEFRRAVEKQILNQKNVQTT